MMETINFELKAIYIQEVAFSPRATDVVLRLEDFEWRYSLSCHFRPRSNEANVTEINLELVYWLYERDVEERAMEACITNVFELTGRPDEESKADLLRVFLQVAIGNLQGVCAAKVADSVYASCIPTAFDVRDQEKYIRKLIQNEWS